MLLYTKIVAARNKAIEISVQCREPLVCDQNHGADNFSAGQCPDNAIEAAANADGEKRVGMVISGDSQNYIFEVTTFNPETNFARGLNVEGFTTKGKGKGGQGISIIRRGVERLRGTVNYNLSDGFCQLRIESPRSVLEGKA